jgi:hypothetical protein
LKGFKRRATSAPAKGNARKLYVRAKELRGPTRVHAVEHDLLGILGQHLEPFAGLALSALLLGLRDRHRAGEPGLGANVRWRRACFFAALGAASGSHILWAIAGGAVFNAANLLLVAAIGVAGLAVAFPLGVGLALIIGVLLNYFLSPTGNPSLLFSGVGLVLLALVVDAVAYRKRETGPRHIGSAGIGLSLLAGGLMGLFYSLVERSLQGAHALGPYSVVPYFAGGIALCSVPANYWLMRHPLPKQEKTCFSEYLAGRPIWHFWACSGVGSGARERC